MVFAVFFGFAAAAGLSAFTAAAGLSAFTAAAGLSAFTAAAGFSAFTAAAGFSAFSVSAVSASGFDDFAAFFVPVAMPVTLIVVYFWRWPWRRR